jgi:hypothetical protein
MKIYSNVSKTPKKKKDPAKTTTVHVREKVGKAPDKSKDGVTMTAKKGETKKTYAAQDVRTGHKEYGKESKTKPTPQFIKDAQDKKKEIVIKNGKPYRAGTSTEKHEGPRLATKMNITPDIRPVKMSTKTVPVKAKTSGKLGGKLKAMGMTYGTDSPKKGGGTKYVDKVKAKKK